MNNLLNETVSVLNQHGKTLFDVVWVGCIDFQIPIDQFVECANQEYDDGYGASEVATDLLVVGSDFWLERHEYDGAEWWEYKELPKMPRETRNIHRVMGGTWDSLEELNMKGADDDNA